MACAIIVEMGRFSLSSTVDHCAYTKAFWSTNTRSSLLSLHYPHTPTTVYTSKTRKQLKKTEKTLLKEVPREGVSSGRSFVEKVNVLNKHVVRTSPRSKEGAPGLLAWMLVCGLRLTARRLQARIRAIEAPVCLPSASGLSVRPVWRCNDNNEVVDCWASSG